MKKKILLTIGSLSASILPISAVIACSPGSKMGEKESKFLEYLKSNDGIRKINNLWLNKALNVIYQNNDAKIKSDLESYIEFFMAEEIRKDDTYLTKLNKSWALELSSEKEKRDDLTDKYAMGDSYDTFSDWTNAFKVTNGTKATFQNFINEYLFDTTGTSLGEKHLISIKTDFLVNAKEALIVKNYLGIDKEDWMKVFGNEDDEKLYDSGLDSNQNVWDLIDSKEFPLILEGMKKHYAYSWNIKITDKDEVNTILESPPKSTGTEAKTGEETAKDMALQFDPDDGKLGKLSSYSEEKKKAIYKYSILPTNSAWALWNFVGFQGITTLPQGKGSLNFKWDDESNWKNKNNPADFNNGFIENEKLLTEDEVVKYAEESADQIDLTLYNGNSLIPTYDSNSQKIKFKILTASPSDREKQRKQNLYWTFINQNKTLYEKAVQYYTNKKNPIQLDADKDPFLKKQLIDMGIKYIKNDDKK